MYMSKPVLSEAQLELLKFINPTDAKDIAIALRKVFNMALFDNKCQISCEDKDNLFYLEKIISISEKI